MPLVRVVARLKNITYRAIETTGKIQIFFYILHPKSFAHKGLDSENKRIQYHPLVLLSMRKNA
jgi:hypothetical protein